MLLVRVPWADRIMALPFLTLLALSKRFYTGKSRAPKTLLDWARQAALQIRRWLPITILRFHRSAKIACQGKGKRFLWGHDSRRLS
jgi:hypothetical protein